VHELSVVKSMVETVEKHAELNGVSRVREISLEIGELTYIVEDLLLKTYYYFRKGTICEDASISIEWQPGIVRCTDCSMIFTVGQRDVLKFICPNCGNNIINVVSGNDFIINSITAD